ncbi:hypothetical protein [Pseudarthrobacter sp. AB1]|nr:hypothetical protein [Pseudarthrobacter sp. AB1]
MIGCAPAADYTGDIAAENYRVVVRHQRGEQPGGGDLKAEPYVRVR